MMFEDRVDAGKQLAKALKGYRSPDVIVLALPRGGVPVAVEIARELGAPLDVLIVRKVGVPYQPELAMGAVMDGSHAVTVRNDDVIRSYGISEEEFQNECAKEMEEIDRRRRQYFGRRVPIDIVGRTVILVDDGIATGATVRAAIVGLRQAGPRKIVLAVPVGASETIEALRQDVDEMVCLEEPAALDAISLHYGDFPQLTDDEILESISSLRLA
ncbi:phosphoribosyltransferase family protein [Phyllobacterium sp. LjRoot231]|uniref:phosphoribosyltransferase n=1 Tax=Phyllobacterium sp. LjRoot231 TaxID=3342289 RepID=UPI003ECF7DC5